MDHSTTTDILQMTFDFLKSNFIAGLIGTCVGAYLVTVREERKERRQFIQQQLSDFYGPLYTSVIQIERSLDRRKQVYERGKLKSSDAIEIFEKEHRVIEVPNRDEMLKILTTKLWLAEESTLEKIGSFYDLMSVGTVLNIEAALSSEVIDTYLCVKDLGLLHEDIRINYARLSGELKSVQTNRFAWINHLKQCISRYKKSEPKSSRVI